MTGHGATRERSVLHALVLLVVLLVAFFAGMAVERIRFDSRRDDMLRRYDEALRQHHEQIMRSEKQPPKTLSR
jgi:hypothetical protein